MGRGQDWIARFTRGRSVNRIAAIEARINEDHQGILRKPGTAQRAIGTVPAVEPAVNHNRAAKGTPARLVIGRLVI